MNTPLYSIDDVVYLRESAGIGFIEAYSVAAVSYDVSGNVIYKLRTGVRPPNNPATIGELSSGLHFLPLLVLESQLVTYCEAVDMAIAVEELKLAELRRYKDANCSSDGTDGTG